MASLVTVKITHTLLSHLLFIQLNKYTVLLSIKCQPIHCEKMSVFKCHFFPSNCQVYLVNPHIFTWRRWMLNWLIKKIIFFWPSLIIPLIMSPVWFIKIYNFFSSCDFLNICSRCGSLLSALNYYFWGILVLYCVWVFLSSFQLFTYFLEKYIYTHVYIFSGRAGFPIMFQVAFDCFIR